MFFRFPEEWSETPSTHGYGTNRVIWGERAMMLIVNVPPNQPLESFHQHPNEQIGIVLEGESTMTIGNETRTLKQGDAYVAPPNVPHGRAAISPGPTRMLEIFSPPREDLIKRATKGRGDTR